MPVNYQQVQQQVREQVKLAPARQKQQRERLEKARGLLARHAVDLQYLQDKVSQAAARDKSLRCAIPLSEPINLVKNAALPAVFPVLLAADGSQINPNRHDAVEFGLINIGVIRLQPVQALTPVEMTSCELFLYQSPENDSGPLTEELVALKRDFKERSELARLAAAEPGVVLTLTDGPLELFREPKGDPRFDRLFEDYLDVMEVLASMNTVTAGYVDKPGADLVVRLLELTLYPDEELQKAGKERQLGGVRDIDLFRDTLQPAERSAIFAIQSSSAEKFSQRLNGHMALHFFYLNVGRVGRPWLVRVELPAWVSQQAELVDLLQATLLQQCRQMGIKAYPYALHRAHEVALVSFQDKQQLQVMIEAEMLRAGLEVGDKSYKQSHKDLEGRKGLKS
ncbi:MAG TPA: DNA double-strand break repair nuclease NurA [Bellilinea sp.]